MPNIYGLFFEFPENSNPLLNGLIFYNFVDLLQIFGPNWDHFIGEKQSLSGFYRRHQPLLMVLVEFGPVYFLRNGIQVHWELIFGGAFERVFLKQGRNILSDVEPFKLPIIKGNVVTVLFEGKFVLIFVLEKRQVLSFFGFQLKLHLKCISIFNHIGLFTHFLFFLHFIYFHTGELLDEGFFCLLVKFIDLRKHLVPTYCEVNLNVLFVAFLKGFWVSFWSLAPTFRFFH